MEITNHNINAFLDTIETNRRVDIETLIALFKKITHKEPQLWGSIIGFGKLHYKYQTGREGYMPILGLANRKNAITLYITMDNSNYRQIDTLGKIKVSKSCIYLNRVSDINLEVLEELAYQSIKDMLALDFIKEL